MKKILPMARTLLLLFVIIGFAGALIFAYIKENKMARISNTTFVELEGIRNQEVKNQNVTNKGVENQNIRDQDIANQEVNDHNEEIQELEDSEEIETALKLDEETENTTDEETKVSDSKTQTINDWTITMNSFEIADEIEGKYSTYRPDDGNKYVIINLTVQHSDTKVKALFDFWPDIETKILYKDKYKYKYDLDKSLSSSDCGSNSLCRNRNNF